MKDNFVNLNNAFDLKKLGYEDKCLLLVHWNKDSDSKTNEQYKPSIWFNGDYADFGYNFDEKLFMKHFENHNNFIIEMGIPFKFEVLKWIRKNFQYNSYIKETGKGIYRFYIEKFEETFYISEIFDNPDNAEDVCINKLIEILKNNLDK